MKIVYRTKEILAGTATLVATTLIFFGIPSCFAAMAVLVAISDSMSIAAKIFFSAWNGMAALGFGLLAVCFIEGCLLDLAFWRGLFRPSSFSRPEIQ